MKVYYEFYTRTLFVWYQKKKKKKNSRIEVEANRSGELKEERNQ